MLNISEECIEMLIAIGFAVLWLVFMLWQDWGQAGKTARARASAKANGWEQDEMQNEISRNAGLIAYRVMTVGLFVMVVVDAVVFRKDTTEFGILLMICMIVELVYKNVVSYQRMLGDEENPPSMKKMVRDIIKSILIPLLVFGGLLRFGWY